MLKSGWVLEATIPPINTKIEMKQSLVKVDRIRVLILDTRKIRIFKMIIE